MPSFRSRGGDAAGSAGPFGEVTRAMRRNIERVETDLAPATLDAAVALLGDPARAVFCLGGRFSTMLASFAHYYLRELRPGVRVVRDMSAAWADDLLDICPGDVLVAFDFRRYQRDVIAFARGARRQGAEIVLVTDVWRSPIAADAAVVIACPVGIPSAFDSAVAGLAAVELVVAGVVDRLGPEARHRIETLETLRGAVNLGG
jgi:DNA-binding MurR/RpiR family transcriptional regulator